MKRLLLLLFFAPLTFWGQITFTDQAKNVGLGDLGPFYGVAITDYDRDGWEDIYVTLRPGANRLYKNIGGSFVDVAPAAGVDVAIDTKAAIWADFNNDGWPDLFLANKKGVADMLFQNDGKGKFVNVSSSAGIEHSGDPFAVVTSDVNGDGFLDIYIAHFDGQNVLWRNNGNMTFTDITVKAGVTDNFIAMGATFIDFDNDGDEDLYLTHDGYGPNIMFLNDGAGNFYNVAPAIHANIAAFGMGVDVGDINNDGWLDLYITNLYPNNLLLNDGNGSYTDITASAEVGDPGMGWGTAFLDADNDGLQDIYIANTPGYPNLLYRNKGDSTFEVVSNGTALSIERAVSYGVATMDYNKDGKIDIILTNYNDTTGLQVFRNETPDNNHWFEVKLKSDKMDHTAISTRVEVKAGDYYGVDVVSGGSSWAAQHSQTLHFGLGSETMIDTLIITWADGEVYEYYQIQADQIFEAVQLGLPSSVNQPEVERAYHFQKDDAHFIHLPPSTGNLYAISVFSTSGALILEHKIQPSTQIEEWEIPTSTLARGIYLIRIQEGERNKNLKFALD